MGWMLEDIKILDGSSDSSRMTHREMETWFLEKDAEDTGTFDPYVMYQKFRLHGNYPRHGRYHKLNSWMSVANTSFSSIKITGDDRLYIEVTVDYEGPPPPEVGTGGEEEITLIPPWRKGIENYRQDGVLVEEALKHLYDDYGNRYPFLTSAGTEVSATRSRALLQISFSYNLRLSDYIEENTTDFREKVNINPIRIAGRTYRAGQVMCSGLSAELATFEYEQDDQTLSVDYWKVNVTFTIDPGTWWRRFLNVSTYFLPKVGQPMARLWSTESEQKAAGAEAPVGLVDYWGNPINDYQGTQAKIDSKTVTRHFGTLEQMTEISNSNIEPINEPIFLFPKSNFGFMKPNVFGFPVDATGGFLPFDISSGQQFLGTYNSDNAANPRFGKWSPVGYDNNGNFTLLATDDPDLDQKLVHETYIEGYENQLIDFTDLHIPTERYGLRT